MPQLVKGGKHVYGWCRIHDDGSITIPPEALAEYGLLEGESVIVMPGSRRSGGFGLARAESLVQSPVGAFLKECPELASFDLPEGEVTEIDARRYCWVAVRDGSVRLSPAMLSAYGIDPGGRLLVGRGSHMAISFIARGIIVEEGRRHPELEVF
jgi:hypothetical protein